MNAIHSTRSETVRSWRRRRIVWLCAAAWTVFVGVALWWLLGGHAGPTVWLVREAPPNPTGMTERDRIFSRTEFGLQRGYPWILLGPYVALVASLFPLERGRFRLSLPMNLAACAAFVAACQGINARTRMTFTGVLFVNSDPARGETNAVHVQITGTGRLRLEDVITNLSLGNPVNGTLSGNTAEAVAGHKNASGSRATNLSTFPRPALKLPPRPPGNPSFNLWSMLEDLLAYGAVVGLAHSVHFYRRFREREQRAFLLESNLSKARFNTLRAQLHPHFLFNCLNAIAALLRRDPRLAEATLMSLSELLRLTLSQSERQEIPLREEMQLVERYLEIQQTRFADKLHVEREIEPAALDCLVPALILQPLVENAIRHGIEPAEKSGLVRLTARGGNGKLILTVEDDGVGLVGGASKNGTGIGLTNLRARLESLYGTTQALELVPRREAGMLVRAEIPWRTGLASGQSDQARAFFSREDSVQPHE